jgi:DNA-directed RNA polymerase subunit RPC12/RpoP
MEVVSFEIYILYAKCMGKRIAAYQRGGCMNMSAGDDRWILFHASILAHISKKYTKRYNARMHFTCPECKNEVSLKGAPVKKGQVIECEMCGISLIVDAVEGDVISVEIADEGK